MEQFSVAIDIGAGQGVKTGLFLDPHRQVASGLLPRSEFDETPEDFVGCLLKAVDRLVRDEGTTLKHVRAIGIASPGLFCSDGSYLLAANLPFLGGQNLKEWISQEVGVPTGIDNDANLGGLAEWSILRTELLYWVFGGGWGGAWVDASGTVKFPSLDWGGDDEALHYSNEPGYSIPLDKLTLKTLFYQFGASFDRFEQIVIEDLNPSEGLLTGPAGDPDSIRAEVVLSGPGRCRLFRAVVGDDDFYTRFLDIHETRQMTDFSVAGKHISKLSLMRVEAAVNTDRLFGKILAIATQTLFKQARCQGLPDAVPISLGGKPSYALPYFGPSAQSRLGALGIMSYMRPSIIDERGLNANLVGAAVLADKVASNRESPAKV